MYELFEQKYIECEKSLFLIAISYLHNTEDAKNSDIEDAITTAIDGEEILIKLPIKDTSLNINDTYTLEISTIYGLSKADQPLKITGDWKCEFKR